MRILYPQRLRPLLLLAVLLMLRAGQCLFAQVPTWQDAISPGAGSGNSTTVDAAGNTYVTGVFGGTATFGAITLTSAGRSDIFVAKRTPMGVWQWATSTGGSDYDVVNGVAVDGNGNVVITGSFGSPTIAFGATTLTNAGSADLFVAKLTPMGTWLWATGAGGSGSDGGSSVAADGSGSVVVTGYFRSQAISFGATTLTCAGQIDLFVVKLTPTGAWQWATSAGGSDYDVGRGVTVDGSGNVVVTGSFDSPTLPFGATTLTNVGSSIDIFVAKLTPAGAWQWATGVGGSISDVSNGVAVDGSGNVVITGFFSSLTLAFGATTLTNVNVGYEDMFVAKLTPTGAWQWATGAGGSGTDIGNGVAVDGSGNVVVTGYFDSPTLSFGATTLTNVSVGYADTFVAKLTPTSAWQWAIGVQGSDFDVSNGVAVDGSGNVVVTGYFYSPTLTFGTTNLTNPLVGVEAIFLARLSAANGLPEDPTQPAFTLAPNPARTTVQLTGAAGTTATLLDALGRVVRTWHLEPGTSNLDISALPAGLYLVRVGTSQARRLVVE